MVANQNAIKRSWDISQKAQDNKEKIQALEHYLDSHIQLWTLLYGGEDHMARFGKSMPSQQYQYKEDELALQKVNPSPVMCLILINPCMFTLLIHTGSSLTISLC